MSALAYLVPAALLVYFLYRSMRARIYLLGIPFLMYMSDAVFLDRLRIFAVPGRLEPADHMMIWLVLVWLVCSDLLLPERFRSPSGEATPRRRPFSGGLIVPEEVILLGVAALVLLNIVIEAVGAGALVPALAEAKGFIYLLVGFALVLDVVARSSRQHVVGFLGALVLANTVAAALFIGHQGLGLSIYAGETEYQVFTFMGQRLTRSFYFMPQLLGLAVAWAFAKRKWDWWAIAVVVITFGALWVSYTRSLLVIAVAEIALVLALRLFKRRQAGVVVRRLLSLAAIVVVLGALVFVFLPAQTQYFLSRIDVAVASPNVAQEPNLVNRQDKMRLTWEWVGQDGRAIGVGFPSSTVDSRVTRMEGMAPDIVWVPVLFRLGVIGVALFAALYLSGLWRAGRSMLRAPEEREYLWLVLACVVLASAFEGFVSWTFMNPFKTPLGLWPFALVCGLVLIERRGDDAVGVEEAEGADEGSAKGTA